MSEAPLLPAEDNVYDQRTSDQVTSSQTDVDTEAERLAAIETLVTLAATIEAARIGIETTDAPVTEAPPARVPQFLADEVEVADFSAALHASEMTNAEQQQTSAPTPQPISPDYVSHLREALRAHYPEASLLLVAIALIGIGAYASAPRTSPSLPVPAIAEIRPEEAIPPPVPPASDDARLKFVGTQSCGAGACETLLTLAPVPAAPAEGNTSASFTAAAEPEAAAESAETAGAPSPPEELATPLAQTVLPPDVAMSLEPPPVTEQINTESVAAEPIKAEPVGTEPVLPIEAPTVAAEAPSSAPIEPIADIANTTLTSVEDNPDSLPESPVESAAIVPEASKVETLDIEIYATSKSAAKQPSSNAPATVERAVKTVPAKTKTPQAAKKSAVAALPKTGPAKAAPVKPAIKAAPADKQTTTTSKATANKAPAFPSANTPSLFKPVTPPAVASTSPEPTPETGFAPGDKPPGFEIQTRLGGGFFTLQPY